MTGFKIYPALFISFCKIGMFTLGGGYAMLPLIEREVVMRRRWIDANDFLDALAIVQSLPGPVAVNTSAFVGYKTRGLPGALAAAFGCALPSFIVMLLVAAFFVTARTNEHVAAVFAGLRPAVAALIGAAVWNLAVKTKLDLKRGALTIAAALAVWLGGISPAWIVIAIALTGALLMPRKQPAKNGDNA